MHWLGLSRGVDYYRRFGFVIGGGVKGLKALWGGGELAFDDVRFLKEVDCCWRWEVYAEQMRLRVSAPSDVVLNDTEGGVVVRVLPVRLSCVCFHRLGLVFIVETSSCLPCCVCPYGCVRRSLRAVGRAMLLVACGGCWAVRVICVLRGGLHVC